VSVAGTSVFAEPPAPPRAPTLDERVTSIDARLSRLTKWVVIMGVVQILSGHISPDTLAAIVRAVLGAH
jgi:regulator of extracellular matrix RemA (YlzA/DUF370 family)